MVSRLEGQQQRHDSVDGPRNNTVSYRDERRERITTARLVRILDLSSNSLSGLEGMVGLEHREHDGERGEVVLRRLKGLHRLDLKQNQLCRLPRLLMEGLKKLSILNLSCNHFDKMPSECVLSPALTYLNISSNRVGGSLVANRLGTFFSSQSLSSILASYPGYCKSRCLSTPATAWIRG